MNTRRAIACMLLSSCAMFASIAHADIGGIGSPVVPSNPSPAAPADKGAAAQPAAAGNTEERIPLLIIRFNQQHVYFERVMRQAVEATNKAKPGALYDVVSLVPAGGTLEQSDHINSGAADNLNAVVQELQTLGVPPAQIRVTTQSSSTMNAQEIDIYVN